MTPSRYESFLWDDLSPEEEEAFLREHPELADELALNMWVDGELPEEEANDLRERLRTDETLQSKLTSIVALEAVLIEPPQHRPANGAPSPDTVVAASPTDAPTEPPKKPPVLMGPWLWAPLAVAAAAAVVVTVQPPPQPKLAIQMLDGRGAVRAKTGIVGETLRLSTPVHWLYRSTLRLYDETSLLAECPSHPSCRREGAFLVLEWELDEPGRLQALITISRFALPGSRGGILDDADTIEARSVKHDLKVIDVRAQ